MRKYVFISLALLLFYSGSAMAAGKFIMITASGNVNAHEQKLADFLRGLGFEVETHDDDEQDPVDLKGAAAVMVTESITSGNVADGYNDAPIPVIANEAWIWDDMGFVADGTQFKDVDTTIVIEDPNHVITEGFEGEVEITSQPVTLMSASAFQGDARVLAAVKSTGNVTLAIYGEGAQTGKGEAPANRVAIFLFDDTPSVLKDSGWTLVERSVRWALGELVQPVSPAGALAVTWGSLKSGHR